jgi:hypothetical protein
MPQQPNETPRTRPGFGLTAVGSGQADDDKVAESLSRAAPLPTSTIRPWPRPAPPSPPGPPTPQHPAGSLESIAARYKEQVAQQKPAFGLTRIDTPKPKEK